MKRNCGHFSFGAFRTHSPSPSNMSGPQGWPFESLSPGYQRQEPVAKRSCLSYRPRSVRNIIHGVLLIDGTVHCWIIDVATLDVSAGKRLSNCFGSIGIGPAAGRGASSIVYS